MMEAFEEYTNIPFVLPETGNNYKQQRCLYMYEMTTFVNLQFFSTDQVAIPDFAAGAMENWGLILYREPALLYNPDFSTTEDKQFVEEVVAHELGHMVRDTEILSVLSNQ